MQRKVVQFLVELLFCVCTYLFNQLMDFAYNTICEALKIDGNSFVSVLNTQKNCSMHDYYMKCTISVNDISGLFIKHINIYGIDIL